MSKVCPTEVDDETDGKSEEWLGVRLKDVVEKFEDTVRRSDPSVRLPTVARSGFATAMNCRKERMWMGKVLPAAAR